MSSLASKVVLFLCACTAGLWQTGGDTYLLSIRDIEEGEELSFDYSTSMVDEPWSMECACGDALCRGHIANFLDMPDSVQQYYAGLGCLPEHVWATAAARNVVLKRGNLVTALAASGGSSGSVSPTNSTSSTEAPQTVQA